MKFSVSLPTGFEGLMYPVPFVAPEDFVRLAIACERLGYHSAWGNDHLTTQHYVRDLFPGAPPNFYEVMTVLSFCAAATNTIKVGTAVAVLPMRDPFWLAKQAATLDPALGRTPDPGAWHRRLPRGVPGLGAACWPHRTPWRHAGRRSGPAAPAHDAGRCPGPAATHTK